MSDSTYSATYSTVRVCACGALLATYNTNHPTMRPMPGDLTTCRCGLPLIFELAERVLGAAVLRPRPLTADELEALPTYLRAQLEIHMGLPR